MNLISEEFAMSCASHPKTLETERAISASEEEVFAAFERPELLSQWWGPKGFTNSFETFEFHPGGRWVFTMHGPNGIDYPNECRFRELVPGRKVVIEHVVEPWFTLTVTLTPRGDQTHLVWAQEFESAEVAAKFRPLCSGPNEENLDRLEEVLAREATGQK